MESPKTPMRALFPLASRSPIASPTHKSQESSPVVIPPPVLKSFSVDVGTSFPTNFRSSADDPFAESSTFTNEKNPKLSVIADPFLPGALVSELPVSANFKTSPPASTPSCSSTPSIMSGRTLQEPASPEETRPWNGVFDHVFPTGEFTGGNFSRFPKLTGIAEDLSVDAIKVMIKFDTFTPPERIISVEHLRREGTVILQFANIKDAINAGGEIAWFCKGWKLKGYLNARDFSELLEDRTGPLWSPHQGHLAVVGIWRGPEKFTTAEIADYLVRTMKQHGEILAWEQVKTTTRQVFVHMEFYNVHDAEKAIVALKGFKDEDLEVSVQEYVPGFEEHALPAVMPLNVQAELSEGLTSTLRAFTFGDTTFVASPSARESSSAGNVSADPSSDVRASSSTNKAPVTASSADQGSAGPSSDVRASSSTGNALGRSSSDARTSLTSNKPSAVASSDVRVSSSSGTVLRGSATNFYSTSSTGNAFPRSSSDVRTSFASGNAPIIASSDVRVKSSSGNVLAGSAANFYPSHSTGNVFGRPSSDVRTSFTSGNAPFVSSDSGMPFSSGNTLVGAPFDAPPSFSASGTSFRNPSEAPMSFAMNDQNFSGYGAIQGPPMPSRSFGTLPFSGNNVLYNNNASYGNNPSYGNNVPYGNDASYGDNTSYGNNIPYGNNNSYGQPPYAPFPVPNYGHNYPGTSGFGPGFLNPMLESMTRHPTGRVAPRDRFTAPGGFRDAFNDHNLGANNAVSCHRIHRGMDVRTTVMLRNIPNKMHQPELKQLVDSTSFGDYDFMYLRIDFANNCNVGYAFINFVDPMGVAKFVTGRAGVRWPGHHSEKVAMICYATIQGKDCLIQKFRNSSIMLEDPSFRPKLFHTGTGPMAGREEIFPGPDNDTKLRRSIENAGAVGLFAPRASQNFRDNQRRRRSRFDRGNRFAQIEEEGYGPRSGSFGYENDSGAGMPYIPHPLPPNMQL